jgi:hypothetical protein
MQSATWIALIQKIPANQHDNLMLITLNGIEINIQAILRLEEEYLVLRGRLAGTDKGRTLFLPYAQITYLGFQKVVKEADVRAMFGEVMAAPPPPVEQPAEEEPAPAAEAPKPEVVQPAPATPEPAPPKPAPRALPDKKSLLERLRARSQAAMRQPADE